MTKKEHIRRLLGYGLTRAYIAKQLETTEDYVAEIQANKDRSAYAHSYHRARYDSDPEYRERKRRIAREYQRKRYGYKSQSVASRV